MEPWTVVLRLTTWLEYERDAKGSAPLGKSVPGFRPCPTCGALTVLLRGPGRTWGTPMGAVHPCPAKEGP